MLVLRSALVFLAFIAVLITSATAATIANQPRQFQAPGATYLSYTDLGAAYHPDYPSTYAYGLSSPSTPDNWLGGTGNWSNAADWSSGLPSSSSDVAIKTGNDNVTLDTSSSINTLTLGGASGSSILMGDGNARTLTIAGALTVNHSGNLSLSNDTVTAGASSTNSGSIDLENGSSLQITGDFTNSNSLNAGVNFTFGNSLTVTGTLTNTGGITLGSASDPLHGTATATVAALVNSGGIFVDGGSSLQVSGNANNSSIISTGASGSSNDGGNNVSIAGTLTNTGTIQVDGIMDGFGAGTLINSGIVNIVGQNSLAGFGTVNNNQAGQISVSFNSTFSATNMTNAGSFTTFNNGDQLDQGNKVNITGTLTNQGSFMLTDHFDTLTIGTLNNSGTLQLMGSQESATISANSVNSGTIDVESGSTINILGTLTNNSGGTFSLNTGANVANIYSVTNQGTVSIASGAKMFVGGASVAPSPQSGFTNSGLVDIQQGGSLSSNSYTQTAGQTTIDGTLTLSNRGVVNFAGGSVFGNGGTINGSVVSNAAFNLGDGLMTIGNLAIHGAYTQGLHGSLTADIASLTQYDQLNISGHATLNGLLTVDLLHGFVPQIGNTFDIMNFAGESGQFAMVVGLPINNQEHFVLEYNATNLTLDVVPGQLSQAAFSALISKEWPNPGYISGTSHNGVPASTTPEPGSILLFGSGLLGLAGMFRRKRG